MKNKRVFRAISMVTQVSISMMVPIFLCVYFGLWLDKKFQTNYWFLILMILGFLAAIRNVYYLTKSFYEKDKEREDANMRYYENMRESYNKKNQKSGKEK